MQKTRNNCSEEADMKTLIITIALLIFGVGSGCGDDTKGTGAADAKIDGNPQTEPAESN